MMPNGVDFPFFLSSVRCSICVLHAADSILILIFIIVIVIIIIIIVMCRQGDMARWLPVSNMWQDCHFVLTRAGFLHWFHDTESVRPLDCLNLARCQFEAGEAPTFNLVENNTGRLWFFSNWLRTIAFKAPTVEDSCEWAIALREAIATARGEDNKTY